MMRKIRGRSARCLALLLILQLLAAPRAHAQYAAIDINDIRGVPSSVPIRRTQRRAPIIIRQRVNTAAIYRKGFEEGQKKALDRMALALPAPMLAQAATREVVQEKVVTVPLTPQTEVIHTQTLAVQFTDPKKRPIAGIEVVPVLRPKEGPEQRLEPRRTDAQGQVRLAGLKELPVNVEFRLPGEESSAEWRYRDPAAAFLVLDRFQGRAQQVASVPLPGPRLASLSLLPGLLFGAVAPAKAKAAVEAATKARDRITLGRELLGDKDIQDTAPEIQKSARRLFAEGTALAEEAIRLDPALVRGYQYLAEALWFSGDRQTAIKKLEYAKSKFPKSVDLAKQLANYNTLLADAKPPAPVVEKPPVKPAVVVETPKARVVTIAHVEQAPPVVLERTVVDIALQLPEGAEDAKIWVPAAAGAADRDGRLAAEARLTELQGERDGRTVRFRLPADEFSAGPVPFRLARTTAGAEFEAVVEDYRAPDPYAPVNEVAVPPLRLVRLTDAQPPRGIDVLSPVSAARRAFSGIPKPDEKKRKKNDPPPAEDNADGSRTIQDEQAGVQFRVRPLPSGLGATDDKKKDREKDDERAERAVEAIRLTRAEAGTLGGIHVGDDVAQVRKVLGPPEGDGKDGLSYMQGGVRFLISGDRVTAIDLLRPTQLLREGTTAFVARRPARLYVEKFNAGEGRMVRDRALFESYLERTGVVRVVRQREDADYVLSARVEEFKENRDQLIGTVPLKYECSAEMEYSLYDNAADRWVVQNGRVESSKRSNWTADFGKIALGSALLGRLAGGGLGALLGTGLGAAGIDALRKSMGRAIRRTPPLVEQGIYNQLTDRLYREIDFAGRVTGMDYAKGEVIVNLGTADGVAPADAGRPGTAFDVSIGNHPLPSKEEGLSADFYTLEVVAASEHESRCVLKHVTRKLVGKGTREEIEVKEDPEMLRRIPQPQTGVVNVRIRNRLLPINDL